MKQSLYQSTRVRFADKVAIDKDWIVDQPSEADGQAAFANLLFALRRPEDAAARAEAALELTPGHARAQAVLARVRASQGQVDAAATLIAAAVKAAGDSDYLPAYYHARLLLRGEGQHGVTITPDSAGQALLLLEQVIARQPSQADAHGLAAYAALIVDEPKAAQAHAAKAFTLSPRHEFALLHARARVFQRDKAVRPGAEGAARARLERLDPPRSAGAARFPGQGGKPGIGRRQSRITRGQRPALPAARRRRRARHE